MILFPVFFRLAHLALQIVNKDYAIFSQLRHQKWTKTKNDKWDEQNKKVENDWQ